MSTDKKLKELYCSTFNEVHASDELKGLVENMANNKKSLWKSTMKKTVAVAAMAAFVLATGNIATYAATGSDLISYVTVKINNQKMDLEKDLNFEEKVDENGNSYLQGEYNVDGEEVKVEISEESLDDTDISIESFKNEDDTESTVDIQIKPNSSQK